MRLCLLLLPTLFLLGSCGNIDLPTPAEQQAARTELPSVFAPVALSRRHGQSVIALRWAVKEPSFTETKWRWQEVEVTAEANSAGTTGITIARTVTLDPRALSKTVPAAYSRDTWALELRCEDGPCITEEVTSIVTENGGRSFSETERTTSRTHLWLFEEYQPRDEALILVRRAIGAAPR